MRIAGMIALLLWGMGLTAAALPGFLKVGPQGVLTIDTITLQVCHVAAEWKQTRQSGLTSAIRREAASGAIEFSGLLGTSGIRLEETVTPVSADAFRCEYKASAEQPVSTRLLCLQFQLPAATPYLHLDGKRTMLPEVYAKAVPALAQTSCQSLAVALPGGSELLFTGDLLVRVADERRVGQEFFTVWLIFRPLSEKLQPVREAELAFTLQRKPLAAAVVSIAPAANMGFADEVAGDGKGGWTDQGPTNDLRMMKPGPLAVGDLKFDVLDPVRNEGKSAIVLGRGFPRQAAVEVPAAVRGGQLFLLHASAWHQPGLHGNLVVSYRDGSRETIPVEHARDIGNWHSPGDLPNGLLAWQGEIAAAAVGLYASQFPLRRDDPAGIAFEQVNPGSQWLIIGVTVGDRPLGLRALAARPYVLQAGREYAPLDPPGLIRAGSLLDFSNQLEAPAGRFGRVIVTPEGHFSFAAAPEKRIRFVGTNFCDYSCFPNHREAEAMAESLARLGYNSVRIHHHDRHMVKPGSHPLELNPEAMDKLDYFFAELKKRGIYVVTDLYCSRPLTEKDNVPEWLPPSDNNDMKILLPVSAAARENWKCFVSIWMNHRNPYTGLTWGEDPALVFATLVNENNVYHRMRHNAKYNPIYAKQFPGWMNRNHPGKTPGAAEWKNRHYQEFLFALQAESRKELTAFIRDELKLQLLLTDANQNDLAPLTLDRARFDFADNHTYMDHPDFPLRAWKLPMSFTQTSVIDQVERGKLPAPLDIAATRIFGKPFTLTEFNYCSPNRYRSEAGPLFGGIAALQDWDGLWRFNHANWHPAGWEKPAPITVFDAWADPLALLSDKLMMLLFRRGDLAPAKEAVVYPVPEDFWRRNLPLEYPQAFQSLVLSARIGSSVGAPTGGLTPYTGQTAVAANGGFTLDAAAKTLTIETPMTESVTLAKGAAAAGRLSVSGAVSPQTAAVSSFDGKPVGESRELLFMHLPGVFSEGVRFADASLRRQENYGKGGRLVRREKVAIRLKLEGEGVPRVEALKFSGEPCGAVASEFLEGVLRFTADTAAFPSGVMLYRITR